ncbi:MAG: Mo-dependent nitrogenase C-terminal domain-containing protein [Pseudanabaenaceae cyanobacterium bins.68]|nr:Mo-dependent nitrogenase C-terminal domain-containing protein [Pseudanabaenaceae cyanobacterium bins.68]
MTNNQYNSTQISAWVQGLVAIAKADQNFSREEQQLLQVFTQDLGIEEQINSNQSSIPPTDLAAALGNDPQVADDFLRMAVAIALADGEYSEAEDQLIHQFSQALQRELTIMSEIRAQLDQSSAPHPDLLAPIKDWLDQINVADPRLARILCRAIPAQCPFERDVVFFGHKILHIPPMCKINPIYDQLVGLRYRALCYLADVCQEDVSALIR